MGVQRRFVRRTDRRCFLMLVYIPLKSIDHGGDQIPDFVSVVKFHALGEASREFSRDTQNIVCYCLDRSLPRG